MDKWRRMQELLISNNTISVATPISYYKLSCFRWLIANAIVFIFQSTGLSISTLQQDVLPLWFASGAACAFIFMRGAGILPGIWLGSYFAYYSAGANMLVAFSSASIWAMQAYLLLLFSCRCLTPTLIFRKRYSLFIFITFSSVLAGVTAYFLMLVSRQSILLLGDSTQLCLSWWLSNLNGILILGLAIYTWDYYFPQLSDLTHRKKIQIAIYALIIMLLGIFLVCTVNPFFLSILLFLVMLVISNLSYQFGWCGAVGAVFEFGMVLSMADLINAPVFTTNFITTMPLFLQTLLLITTIVNLILFATD